MHAPRDHLDTRNLAVVQLTDAIFADEGARTRWQVHACQAAQLAASTRDAISSLDDSAMDALNRLHDRRDPLPQVAQFRLPGTIPPDLPCDPFTLDLSAPDVSLDDPDQYVARLVDAIMQTDTVHTPIEDNEPAIDALIATLRARAGPPLQHRSTAEDLATAFWMQRHEERRYVEPWTTTLFSTLYNEEARVNFVATPYQQCLCDVSCTMGPTGDRQCNVTCFDSPLDNETVHRAIQSNRRQRMECRRNQLIRNRFFRQLDQASATDSPAGVPSHSVNVAFQKENANEDAARRTALSDVLQLRVNLLALARERRQPCDVSPDIADILDEVRDHWDPTQSDDFPTDDDAVIPVVHRAQMQLTPSSGRGQRTRAMVDSGANIDLCGRVLIPLLADIHDISPIPLGTAIGGGEPQWITQCGYLPLSRDDGTPFRVKVYIHPSAADTILSPEAIMHSHDDFYKWVQQGNREGHGTITFYSRDDRPLLTLDLRALNKLYYYELALPTWTLESTAQKLVHASPQCLTLSVPVAGDSGSPDDRPEEETSQPSPRPRPVPRTRIGKAPTTAAHQLESEKWSLRMGVPGEEAMHELAKHASGLPNQFQFHPFHFIDHKEAAQIRKQAAGRLAFKTDVNGEHLSMDFGFIRSSTSDFSRPNLKTDRVVKSFDGFNSYLLIVDQASRYAWVFLCVSKEPPIDIISTFLATNGCSTGGTIRCDQGGELARSTKFRSTMLLHHNYKVEPTGADSPSQNGGAERLNGTLAVLVRTLLYGAALSAKYWSAALVHAIYLYNRRVHSAIGRTPYEAWNGIKPNLSRLRTFGARVCVKRTGKRRSKLDQHHFTGIFLGYTATDRNIRYIDLTSPRNDVRSCAHAVFDEAWYLQPASSRPPAASFLYNLGLYVESDFVEPPLASVEDRAAPWPPSAPLAPKPKDLTPACMHPLPLRESLGTRSHSHPAAAAARVHSTEPPTVVDEYNITKKDLAQIYISPHPYDDAFEEELPLATYKAADHPTAGMEFDLVDDRLTLTTICPGAPAHRISRWKSRLRNAWLAQIDGQVVKSVEDVRRLLTAAAAAKQQSCTLLFARPEIKHGLTNSGIPQVNIDQLNPRTRLRVDRSSPTGIPMTTNTVATLRDPDGGVYSWQNASAYKLTRGALMKSPDWDDWLQSEFAQLDQYDAQGMFGDPVQATRDLSIFNLVWSYAVKELDQRKKARCTCDGSTRGGQVRVLDHTYANCVDHTSSRLFYALAAMENHMIYGADVTNAFGEAPPPKQGFYIRPDRAFRTWWKTRRGTDLAPDDTVPVLAAMQGHPEAGRLWEKHADVILRQCGLTPTTHEPCLYSGLIDGERVLFMRQVDDFAIAAPSERVANILFDMIDEELTFPLKRMGLVTLFNGVDVTQTRDYIKLSVETYINKILPKYLESPIHLRVDDFRARGTPLPSRQTFERDFINTHGDPDTAAQEELAKKMGFRYRSAVGELIYAMVTCRPDLSYGVMRASQANSCPAEIHYNGVKHMLKYLYNTKSDGIYFWRERPNSKFPPGPLPTINSNEHDLLSDGRPIDKAGDLVGYVDADWASCAKTRRSVTGVCIRMAGGTVAYKSRLQPTVAQSSTEAEFMGANDAGKTILFIRSVLWDLGIPQSKATLLYEDNDACTAMANARKPTPRTRHMDIKYHVLCEWVERDLLKLVRIHTSLNMADHFTKSLGPILFHRHIDYILGHVPPSYSPCCPR